MSRPFLGVERSLTGRPWLSRLDDAAQAQALAMVQVHGVEDVLARVMAGRGVAAGDVPGFLEPRLRSLLPDPSTLAGMDAAVARLADAVERRETVAIFGDYDVDGAVSCALVAEFLLACGTPFLIHIPDRLTEGYGPNVEAIRDLHRRGGQLLVTVDCGTTSHEPVLEARRLGLDTVVLDHHQAPVTLPDALAIVNPNRQDDLSGLGYLCAAGVVFVTLVGLNRELRRRGFWKPGAEPDLLSMLDLVALGTVADVVPLVGLNRAFVRQGLAVMRARGRLGLRALADVARLDGPPRPYHLGFLLGPRINAGGRIGDAALGARLLISRDEADAIRIAQELERLNAERQAIEQAMVAEAEAEALAMLGLDEEGASVVVVGSDQWHPGVVGLVASRLKERFQRPVFALAFGPNDIGTGSARSVPGVDLGAAVRAAVEAGLVTKGGGHAMAAGVTLERGKVDALREFLERRLAEGVGQARADRALAIDGAITAGGVRADLIDRLELAGPFGSGHPEPIFALPSHRLVDASEVGRGHVRARFRAGDGAALDAIAFRAVGTPLGQALMAARGETVHAAGVLDVNRWQGGERPQLRLTDLARP
ncbi:single-stranded-DNA-specific exonuclease RecJ [Alsobacter sp. SYSU M60028]|uniref:Single-stranded-DNA-specific exonuclease RecJ n=1 Tax=Alsobacter ponti TaxID=2962936 RepID=A0ABT1LDY7_9HYPH|nr:single-stranded-DNA-specific exonuclease RecJ [Alsobacter ponti]MCP8939141.1 single-stranded-DNA-specific exonuclease RecJ [Alsobacter ponti]